MPAPGRTSLEEIIQAGRHILESSGLTQLTMQAVSDRVGVRAPSLYKRVRSRDDLIGNIAEAIVQDLGEQLRAVVRGSDAREDLGKLLRAFRAFAHQNPVGYHLIFTAGSDVERPRRESFARASAPVLRVAAQLAGAENALEAARMITAWAHGFVSMELAGAFNLGGDIDSAFEFGITHLATALDVSMTNRRTPAHVAVRASPYG